MLLRSTILLLSTIALSCSDSNTDQNKDIIEQPIEIVEETSSKDLEKINELDEARTIKLIDLLTNIGVKSEYIDQTVNLINTKTQFGDWDNINIGKIYSAETLTRESIKIINLNFGPYDSKEIGLKVIAITLPTYKVFVSNDYWEESSIKETNVILTSKDKNVSVIGDYLIIESGAGSIKLKN